MEGKNMLIKAGNTVQLVNGQITIILGKRNGKFYTLYRYYTEDGKVQSEDSIFDIARIIG